MVNSRLHPIDRLIRRIQIEAPSAALDLKIARTLYGRAVFWCDVAGQYVIGTKDRRGFMKVRPMPSYTADRHRLNIAVNLLRKHKAALTMAPALRIAA